MVDDLVMAVGVFDLLHPGHLHYLEEARNLGDRLAVVVACNKTVRENKHDPLMDEEVRAEMVGALELVDEVYIGHPKDHYKIVEELEPDTIALGYDQRHRERKIREELKERGLDVEVKRMSHYNHDLDGTRKIIRKIIDWYGMKQRLDEVEEG